MHFGPRRGESYVRGDNERHKDLPSGRGVHIRQSAYRAYGSRPGCSTSHRPLEPTILRRLVVKVLVVFRAKSVAPNWLFTVVVLASHSSTILVDPFTVGHFVPFNMFNHNGIME
jgi:hypothetical protein